MQKKILLLAFLASVCCFGAYAQWEHYDIHPKFPYGPTMEEQQLLPTWHNNVKATTPPVGPVTALAEFHPMGGVMVAYQLGVPVSLIRELSMITSVKVLVSRSTDSNTAKTYFQSNGVNMSNIEYWVINHDTYWTRDYGPWFIVDGNDQVGVVDFTYNRPSRPNDEAALPKVTAKMGLQRYEMPMVHTGGNYMVNGYGTMASTTLVLDENPGETAASLMTMAHSYLGVDDYIIANDPLGDYIEHIDCWGKFLAPNKVLVAQVPVTDSRYTDYEAAAAVFENEVTAWGDHYQVYRVYEPGGNYVTPYTNSLILNDHVFVPITGRQWDNAAIEVYEQAMPGYTIVPVMQSNQTPWYNTDALHCRTHELADPGMLFIKHFPLMGSQSSCSSHTISAEIKPLSGQSLICDSILVYYRTNNGPWQVLSMASVGGSTYEAEIPNHLNNVAIDYYIFAKDQSGRRECHPYIGAADPHHFTIGEVGVNDYTADEMTVNVFPNPAVDYIFVTGEQVKTIGIYDQWGRLIRQHQPDGNVNRINCEEWAAGVYYVVVTDTQGRKVEKKVMKIQR